MRPAAAPDPDFGAAGERIPPPFAIEKVAGPPGAAVLVLSGELDLASADRFRDHVERAIEARPRALVLDVGDVGFMDSSMLKELLRAHGEVSAQGGGVVLAGVQPGVRRLLELTGTIELFRLTETRQAAIDALT